MAAMIKHTPAKL